MNDRAAGFLSSPAGFVRTAAISFGIFAISWGILTYPDFSRQFSIEKTAQRIIAGDPFKIETITAFSAKYEGQYCNSVGFRSAAIIALRLSEDANLTADPERLRETRSALTEAVRKSLACSPADAFLWLVVFRLKSAATEFDDNDLRYLRLSYRLGPNEGWIASKRNGLAFAAFTRLQPDLAEDAIDEFVKLVNSQFYTEAIDILTGVAWPFRSLILPRFAAVNARPREIFANLLYARGYDDLEVPGVTYNSRRPWQRPQH